MTGTDPGSPVTHRLRRALTDVVALVYLALCAVLLVWALAVSVGDDSGGSMAAVIPVLATAPGSLVLFALPEGAVMLVVAVVIGALVNATVIGWCARALRRA